MSFIFYLINMMTAFFSKKVNKCRGFVTYKDTEQSQRHTHVVDRSQYGVMDSQ